MAIYRLMSHGSLRISAKEAGFDQRVGCASSRLASSPPEVRAGEDDENPVTDALLKAAWTRQDQ
jgi:hypothetical protein